MAGTLKHVHLLADLACAKDADEEQYADAGSGDR
jgi:hypothetical protein